MPNRYCAPLLPLVAGGAWDRLQDGDLQSHSRSCILLNLSQVHTSNNVEATFDFVAKKRQQCRTSFALKFRHFDKVECCFDIVAQNGNIVEATATLQATKLPVGFDIVASVDRALQIRQCVRNLNRRTLLCCFIPSPELTSENVVSVITPAGHISIYVYNSTSGTHSIGEYSN